MQTALLLKSNGKPLRKGRGPATALLAIVLFGLLCNGLLLKIVWYPRHQALVTQNNELAGLRRQISSLTGRTSASENEAALAATIIAEAPPDMAVPQLLGNLEAIQHQTGVVYANLSFSQGTADTGKAANSIGQGAARSPSPASTAAAKRSTPSGLDELTITANLGGTYRQVLAFLGQLQQQPRLITINSLTLSSQVDNGLTANGQLSVSLSFTVYAATAYQANAKGGPTATSPARAPVAPAPVSNSGVMRGPALSSPASAPVSLAPVSITGSKVLAAAEIPAGKLWTYLGRITAAAASTVAGFGKAHWLPQHPASGGTDQLGFGLRYLAVPVAGTAGSAPTSPASTPVPPASVSTSGSKVLAAESPAGKLRAYLGRITAAAASTVAGLGKAHWLPQHPAGGGTDQLGFGLRYLAVPVAETAGLTLTSPPSAPVPPAPVLNSGL